MFDKQMFETGALSSMQKYINNGLAPIPLKV